MSDAPDQKPGEVSDRERPSIATALAGWLLSAVICPGLPFIVKVDEPEIFIVGGVVIALTTSFLLASIIARGRAMTFAILGVALSVAHTTIAVGVFFAVCMISMSRNGLMH